MFVKKLVIHLYAFLVTTTATPETTTTTGYKKNTEGQDKLTNQSCLFLPQR